MIVTWKNPGLYLRVDRAYRHYMAGGEVSQLLQIRGERSVKVLKVPAVTRSREMCPEAAVAREKYGRRPEVRIHGFFMAWTV
jgi:hypothetical protein